MAAEVGAEDRPGPTTDRTVGLAVPGTLDPPRHTVVRSINLRFLEGRRLGEELGQRIGRSVILLTDAEASTWGEFRIREQQPESFVHLRLGSGVACGIVLGGELQRLDAGRTGHLDVLVISDRPDAPQCRCGRRGCLEAIASGTALAERASMLGITNGIAGLQTAWERGDEAARRIVHEAAAGVVAASRKLAECYRADVICVGGGVVSHLPSLMQEVMDRCPSSRTSPGEQCRWSVVPARLGDDAGVIGAALLSMQHDRLRA
jgi:predicted NBD/HSP70 family sugar kinase